jgi:hypothetical protein
VIVTLENKESFKMVKRVDMVEKPKTYPVQRAHNRISCFNTVKVIQCLCAMSLHKLLGFK